MMTSEGWLAERPLSPISAFVITAALTGVLHAALMRDDLWLQDSELPREMARLANAYRAG